MSCTPWRHYEAEHGSMQKWSWCLSHFRQPPPYCQMLVYRFPEGIHWLLRSDRSGRFRYSISRGCLHLWKLLATDPLELSSFCTNLLGLTGGSALIAMVMSWTRTFPPGRSGMNHLVSVALPNSDGRFIGAWICCVLDLITFSDLATLPEYI
jgi:hypothetical protein